MIAIAKKSSHTKRCSDWQAGYLTLMPNIVRYASQAFCYLDTEARNEAIQEILVSSMLAYVRLYERGKVDVAYPGVLTRYAIAQYRDGRRVASKSNCQDVLSPYARRRKSIQVESLDGCDRDGDPWREIIVEDKHAGPAETAAVRIDFAEWLASLPRRDRQMAESLSEGLTTKDVAKRFRVSSGRISQKRREFLESWQGFQGES